MGRATETAGGTPAAPGLWERFRSTGRAGQAGGYFGLVVTIASALGNAGWTILTAGLLGALAGALAPPVGVRATRRAWAPSSVIVVFALTLAVAPGIRTWWGDRPLPDPEGCGSWPQYAGDWQSISSAVGVASRTMAFLRVKVSPDGAFTGTYEGYRAIGEADVPAGASGLTLPVSVFEPDGDRHQIAGCVNFDTSTGTATLRPLGDATFTVQTLARSDDDGQEIFMQFPPGFRFSSAKLRPISS